MLTPQLLACSCTAVTAASKLLRTCAQNTHEALGQSDAYPKLGMARRWGCAHSVSSRAYIAGKNNADAHASYRRLFAHFAAVSALQEGRKPSLHECSRIVIITCAPTDGGL
jgi:hypothetical protein